MSNKLFIFLFSIIVLMILVAFGCNKESALQSKKDSNFSEIENTMNNTMNNIAEDIQTSGLENLEKDIEYI